jgi:hypothetical protein
MPEEPKMERVEPGPTFKERLARYAGAPAATAESVSSQLPGRVHGPADAYRHIVWAADMRRRFGPVIARAIAWAHEPGGAPTAGTRMDAYNNEIGYEIGETAETFDDILRRARAVISESAPDGSGRLRDLPAPARKVSGRGARWLLQSSWSRNPVATVASYPPNEWMFWPEQQYTVLAEMPVGQTNWYGNPLRPGGPDWQLGMRREPYYYRYANSGPLPSDW